MPRVSVIIPAYNCADFISDTIESVLGQTFIDFELIVVDDGSTDNTKNVVCSFTDSRLRYFKQSNKGIAAALNAGIQAAIGDLVAILGHDDLFLPEKLSLQLSRIDGDPEIGLVYSKYYGTIGTGAPRRLGGTCHSPLSLPDLLVGHGFMHPSSILVRHAWVEQVNGFDEQLRDGEDDADFYLRLALAGCRMVCIPQPLAVIRQLPNSLAKATYHQRERAISTVLDKAFSDPRMPPEMQVLRSTAYAIRLVQLAVWAYLASRPDAGRDYLGRALAMDPSLAREKVDFLASKIVHRILGLSLETPEETLRLMTSNLPGDDAFSKQLERLLWGKFYEVVAFRSYHLGQPIKCMEYVFQAIGKKPSYLHNRGLLSIFVRSLVGNRIINQFKRLSGTLQRGDGT